MKRLFRCPQHGLIVEILEPENATAPQCGDHKLIELVPNTVDASKEKHVPVMTGGAHGIKVAVGSAPHPMTEEHYIMWIEVINGPYVNRKYLKPGDKPEAEFYVPMQEGLIVRAYCNLHGLWQA